MLLSLSLQPFAPKRLNHQLNHLVPKAMGFRRAPDDEGAMHRRHRDETRICARAANIAREAAASFLNADADGDGQLSWTEFLHVARRLRVQRLGSEPAKKHFGEVQTAKVIDPDEAELQSLFESMDVNGSGTVGMDEFFLWTFDMASRQGCGLDAIFRKYDVSGEGSLDAMAFSFAVEDLGFAPSFAHDLFVELDADASGRVSYSELAHTIQRRIGAGNVRSQRHAASLNFGGAHSWSQAVQVDSQSGRCAAPGMLPGLTSKGSALSWEGLLTGPDEAALREQLQSLLQRTGLAEVDLYALLTMPHVRGGASLPLTRPVLGRALVRLGYTGPAETLTAIFHAIDTNCSGVIGVAELRAWVGGHTDRKLQARHLHLFSPRVSTAELAAMRWDARSLCRAVVAMLQRAELSPVDLMRAWGRPTMPSSPLKGWSFPRQSFLAMTKQLVLTSTTANELTAQAAATEFGLASNEARAEMLAARENEDVWHRVIKPLVKIIMQTIGSHTRVIPLETPPCHRHRHLTTPSPHVQPSHVPLMCIPSCTVPSCTTAVSHTLPSRIYHPRMYTASRVHICSRLPIHSARSSSCCPRTLRPVPAPPPPPPSDPAPPDPHLLTPAS